MKTIIIKNCKVCSKEFFCETKEHNRGNGHFCSLSCAGIYNMSNRKLINLQCKYCNANYKSVNSKSKFCSDSCKQKSYRLQANNNSKHQKSVLDILRSLPCAICGWEESVRDVHHIIPVANGGKNDISNLITLCPNHHRMAHRDQISLNSLIETIKYRTISSP